MINLSNHKLELDYPCDWEYKIVVRNEKMIDAILDDIEQLENYNLDLSKQSSNGKFKSYTLQTIVDNENHRIEIFNILRDHEHIKMVL
jgi:putative lipoic acid-binding regulatory protein